MSTTDPGAGERVATAAGGLAEPLQSTLGDDLCGIGWYSRETYEVVYAAGDRVQCDRDLSRIADDLRLETLNVPAQEGLYDAGDCHCVIRCFEDMTVLAFPAGQAAGVVVAVQSMPETPLQTIVERCRDRLGR